MKDLSELIDRLKRFTSEPFITGIISSLESQQEEIRLLSERLAIVNAMYDGISRELGSVRADRVSIKRDDTRYDELFTAKGALEKALIDVELYRQKWVVAAAERCEYQNLLYQATNDALFGKPKSPWIPMSTPPTEADGDNGQRVLFALEDGRVAHSLWESHRSFMCPATHWMPIPPLPSPASVKPDPSACLRPTDRLSP